MTRVYVDVVCCRQRQGRCEVFFVSLKMKTDSNTSSSLSLIYEHSPSPISDIYMVTLYCRLHPFYNYFPLPQVEVNKDALSKFRYDWLFSAQLLVLNKKYIPVSIYP